jgi:hypothetical protein
MEALVLSLLLWLSANSDYQVAHLSPPQVRLLSPQAMTALYYEQAGAVSGAPAGAPKVDTRIQGYFSWAANAPGTIYLVHPEDTPGAASYTDPTDNPLFRERLLHELVHFAQRAGGAYARFDCPAQGEFDAYRLGGIYLHQLGVPDPMPGRIVWMRRLSAC